MRRPGGRPGPGEARGGRGPEGRPWCRGEARGLSLGIH